MDPVLGTTRLSELGVLISTVVPAWVSLRIIQALLILDNASPAFMDPIENSPEYSPDVSTVDHVPLDLWGFGLSILGWELLFVKTIKVVVSEYWNVRESELLAN